MKRYIGILAWLMAAVVFSPRGLAQEFLAAPFCYGDVPVGRWLRVRSEYVAGTEPTRILVRNGSKMMPLSVRGFSDSSAFVSTDRRVCYEVQQRVDANWRRVPLSGLKKRVRGAKITSKRANLVISWGDPLTSLGVTIKTRDRDGAGTDDAVYVDVGFKAWRVGGNDLKKFERNSTDTFSLPLGDDLRLTLDDLIYIRLEKKGIGGFTGALDSPGGPWNPQEVTIHTNYGPLIIVPVPDITLDHNTPAWLSMLRPLDEHEKIARALRVHRDFSRITAVGRAAAFLTTEFKEAGISGWQNGPIKGDPPVDASIVGTVLADPKRSTDGYATMDVEVERFCTGTRCTRIGSPVGVPQTRYIRIEYKYGNPGKVPRGGVRIRASGRMQWDTDERGFYEIHPIGQSGEKFGTISVVP